MFAATLDTADWTLIPTQNDRPWLSDVPGTPTRLFCTWRTSYLNPWLRVLFTKWANNRENDLTWLERTLQATQIPFHTCTGTDCEPQLKVVKTEIVGTRKEKSCHVFLVMFWLANQANWKYRRQLLLNSESVPSPSLMRKDLYVNSPNLAIAPGKSVSFSSYSTRLSRGCAATGPDTGVHTGIRI